MLASALTAVRAADPEPLKKLYVVMVFDTDDEDLAPSLEKDESRLKSLLKMTILPGRYEIAKTLKKNQVSAAKIVDAIRSLKGKVKADDAVLFFYGGHGAVNDVHGHVLKMTGGGKDLTRSLLRKEMEALGAGLTVLLTDCCSTKEKNDVTQPPPVGPGRGVEIHPTVKHLFFQSRGVVDITAATAAEAAWSDDKNGGLFTRSLAKMLLKTPKQLTGDEDGVVTWQKFFPQLQADTQQFFKDWSAVMRSRYPDANIRAENQKPHAFFLGEQLTYAVVEIQNARPTPLRYKFRWEGDESAPWADFELKPGLRKTHSVPVARGAAADDLPRLEIQRSGAERPDRLRATLWDKDLAPRNVLPFYKIKK
ncbi:MAG: caspase family protein [Gemmataceae bacterium]